MKIRTIIAEDQSDAREGLELLVKDDQNFEVIGMAKDGIEALELIHSLLPDLVLLDIQMPGANGFEILHSLNLKSMPQVVFITAFDEFAIKAFEANAVDYLLKPYTNSRLKEALEKVKRVIISKSLPTSLSDVERLLKFYNEHQPLDRESSGLVEKEIGRFIIREHGRVELVYFHDLIWVEAFDYYTKLHSVNGTYLIRKSLKAIEEELSPEFIRIHRSFIVRTGQVKQVIRSTYGGQVVLKNGHAISVSSRYWKSVKTQLKLCRNTP